jgi:hypothetical protein
MSSFTDDANSAIQTKLAELGGRELCGRDDPRIREIYTISVDGRRFVFSDPSAYNRFDEFVVTELRGLRASEETSGSRG